MHTTPRLFVCLVLALPFVWAAVRYGEVPDEPPKRAEPPKPFAWRFDPTKTALLKAGGGDEESEAAVARALYWLAKTQQADGSWRFDGGSGDDVAATGMALLPFLAAGETHAGGPRYQPTVAAGIRWLLARQAKDGAFGPTGMYGQALATQALCEAYGMTGDAEIKGRAVAAFDYVSAAQAPNGSWGYTPGTPGDTSIGGFQLAALHAGEQAGLQVPEGVYKKAHWFLDDVQTADGAQYGYSSRGASPSLDAVGLRSRLYTGWPAMHPTMEKGVNLLLEHPPDEDPVDVFRLLYATDVVYLVGGRNWHRSWNPKMREVLLKAQVGAGDDHAGSWDGRWDSGSIGGPCGRLGVTCFCVLALEVYYREQPRWYRP